MLGSDDADTKFLHEMLQKKYTLNKKSEELKSANNTKAIKYSVTIHEIRGFSHNIVQCFSRIPNSRRFQNYAADTKSFSSEFESSRAIIIMLYDLSIQTQKTSQLTSHRNLKIG